MEPSNWIATHTNRCHMQTTQPIAPALLTNPEVRARAGIKSHAKLYELIRQGKFPAPIKLGARTSRWPAATVDAWIQKQIDAQGAV